MLEANLAPSAEFMWRTLPNVVCPTLLVRGASSDCVPLAVAERIAAVPPRCDLANIPDSGHFLWFENQTGIEAVIREFFIG